MAYYESSKELTPPLTLHRNTANAPYPDPETCMRVDTAPNGGGTAEGDVVIPAGMPRYVGGVDIETLGPDPCKHALVGIGAMVIDMATNRGVEYFSCFMRIDEGAGYGYDPWCKQDYWDNHAKFPMNVEIKKRFETSNLSTAAGVRLFAEWMDACDAEYGEKGIHWVSDTIGYDTAWISHHFGVQLGRCPIDFVRGDPRQYRSFKHANDFAKGVLGIEAFGDGNWRDKLRARGVEMPAESEHCHNPRDDAGYIAKTYTGALRYLIRTSRATRESRAKKQRVEKNCEGAQ